MGVHARGYGVGGWGGVRPGREGHQGFLKIYLM